MGLDINVFGKLRNITNEKIIIDEDFHNFVYENNLLFISKSLIDWQEQYFKGRHNGLEEDNLYDPQESYSFGAGGYSGYNKWRDLLEDFAVDKDGAFHEQIQFPDNEGIIGPVVSEKLYLDYEKYNEQALEYSKSLVYGDYWYEKYKEWHDAFKMASNNGAVEFY